MKIFFHMPKHPTSFSYYAFSYPWWVLKKYKYSCNELHTKSYDALDISNYEVQEYTNYVFVILMQRYELSKIIFIDMKYKLVYVW